MDIRTRRVGDEDIVHVEGNNDISLWVNEDAEVGIDRYKLNLAYVVSEGVVLYSRGLL